MRDHWLMTVTKTKLERPAAFGGYQLRVNDVFRPTEVTAYRLVGPDGLSEPVASRPYAPAESVDDLVSWLVDGTGMSAGAARALVVQLAMKVHAAALRT